MRAFDLVVLDRDDRPFLIVEVNSRAVTPAVEQDILREIRTEREAIPYGLRIRFAMIGDPHSLRLYRLEDDGSSLLCSWSTAEVLGFYAPDILDGVGNGTGVHEGYLTTLIGSWLEDFAYRWKSPSPPGEDQWRTVGLLPLLIDGSTRSEVPLGFDPVS